MGQWVIIWILDRLKTCHDPYFYAIDRYSFMPTKIPSTLAHSFRAIWIPGTWLIFRLIRIRSTYIRNFRLAEYRQTTMSTETGNEKIKLHFKKDDICHRLCYNVICCLLAGKTQKDGLKSWKNKNMYVTLNQLLDTAYLDHKQI